MYGCESWTVKKAERRRIDAFEVWCWRRLLRDPWTARRSNQSILKEISPGCSLEGMMLKLKLQYFGHLMRRADPLGKTLMLGGIGGRRKRGRQRMRWLNGITTQWTWVWVNSGKWWWTGSLACCDSWGRKESDMTEQLNWIELNWIMLLSQPDFKPFWAQMWFLQLSLEITVENKYLLNNSRVGNLYLIQWLYNNSYFSPQVNLYFIEHIISPFIIESLQEEDVGWITNSFKNYRKKTEWESLFIGSINIIYM